MIKSFVIFDQIDDISKFVMNKNLKCLNQNEWIEKYFFSRNNFNMNKFGKFIEEDFQMVQKIIETVVKQALTLLVAIKVSKGSKRRYGICWYGRYVSDYSSSPFDIRHEHDLVDHLPEHDCYSKSYDAFHRFELLFAGQRKRVETEKMYERALDGKEIALDPEHTSTLNTVNKMGILI